MPSTTVRSSGADDYYRILEVARDVGKDDLKRAYKRQALRWHPDKNQHRSAEAAERFKKVSEAYRALSNAQERAAYNRKRPSAGSNEVVFSKTYGWPGVNVSFYWTGPPPKSDETQHESQGQPPTKATSSESEANAKEGAQAPAEKSALDLFKDMFDMETIDQKLDGFRRQSSIFESVFGSFSSFDATKEDAAVESQPQYPQEQMPWNKAGCTTAMNEKDKRASFIQEEYMRGDLSEAEYKELIGLFNAP